MFILVRSLDLLDTRYEFLSVLYFNIYIQSRTKSTQRLRNDLHAHLYPHQYHKAPFLTSCHLSNRPPSLKRIPIARAKAPSLLHNQPLQRLSLTQHILHNSRTPSTPPPPRTLSPCLLQHSTTPSILCCPSPILRILLRIHQPTFPKTIHSHPAPFPLPDTHGIFIYFQHREIGEKEFRGLDFFAYGIQESFFAEEFDDYGLESVGDRTTEEHLDF